MVVSLVECDLTSYPLGPLRTERKLARDFSRNDPRSHASSAVSEESAESRLVSNRDSKSTTMSASPGDSEIHQGHNYFLSQSPEVEKRKLQSPAFDGRCV